MYPPPDLKNRTMLISFQLKSFQPLKIIASLCPFFDFLIVLSHLNLLLKSVFIFHVFELYMNIIIFNIFFPCFFFFPTKWHVWEMHHIYVCNYSWFILMASYYSFVWIDLRFYLYCWKFGWFSFFSCHNQCCKYFVYVSWCICARSSWVNSSSKTAGSSHIHIYNFIL